MPDHPWAAALKELADLQARHDALLAAIRERLAVLGEMRDEAERSQPQDVYVIEFAMTELRRLQERA